MGNFFKVTRNFHGLKSIGLEIPFVENELIIINDNVIIINILINVFIFSTFNFVYLTHFYNKIKII